VNTVLGNKILAYDSYISLNEELIRVFISGKIEINKQWQHIKNILAITVIFLLYGLQKPRDMAEIISDTTMTQTTKSLDKRFGIFCRKSLFDKTKMIY
jgi:hypothetical protein